MAIANGDGFFSQGRMNAASDVVRTSQMVERLEELEAARLGIRVSEVRIIIARRIRMSAATIANLRRGRRKAVKSDEIGNIRAALIWALQKQVVGLEHEIHLHLQAGADPRDDDLAAAQAALVEARAKLTKAMR